MKLAIMQPYFCPYIGYFQLMASVDVFVVYDNIKYTKKGWVNRNRILLNGKDEYVTLTLKKDSDYLNINQRYLSDEFERDKTKLLNRIQESYRRAPNFDNIYPLITQIFDYPSKNLFDFIYNSIVVWHNYLGIKCKIIKSSTLGFNIEEYRGEEKVLAICEYLKADMYINSIGGQELYKRDSFKARDIELKFIKSHPIIYKQFNKDFIPWLSIVDVLMFNSIEEINEMLGKYVLL